MKPANKLGLTHAAWAKNRPSKNGQLCLSRDERLRKRRDFISVYDRGLRHKGPHLTLFYLANKLDYNRLGISVSKKRFRLSVQRHYIQRLLRSAYRESKWSFLPGYDLVIVAHKFSAKKVDFAVIKQELLSVAGKKGLIKADVQFCTKWTTLSIPC